MKLPRNITADILIKKLEKYGYSVVRQSGSHIRITTTLNGIHHETIPYHKSLKIGTLNCILKNIASHHGLTKEQLTENLELS